MKIQNNVEDGSVDIHLTEEDINLMSPVAFQLWNALGEIFMEEG